MKSRLLGAACASIALTLAFTSHQCGAASVAYEYSGNPYTFATAPYTTDMFVTARIELDGLLPTGLNLEDITGLPGFAITISDGLIALDSTVPTVNVIDVLVTSDTDGSITEWVINVAQDNPGPDLGPQIITQFAPSTPFNTIDSADPDGIGGSEAFVIDNPGSWSVIPLPPAVWLFGSGLLGLIGIARRKNAA